MLMSKAIQLAMLASVMLWDTRSEAATTFKMCGRNLGEIMSRVCHAYNSPSWDVPTVVEQQAAAVRRKRFVEEEGIADICCMKGCSMQQLSEYCAVSVFSESPLDALDQSHMIADRSAEEGAAAPVVVGSDGYAVGAGSVRREVGRARSRGAP